MNEQSKDGVQWWRTDPWYGAHLFSENRARFPEEELEKYLGKYVAWFPDGSGIIDSDPDPGALRARVEAAGYDPLMYRIEDMTGESYI
jgi:hypothetical protein